MILKICGCTIVFLSSFIMGYTFKINSKKRLGLLENMLRCMQCMETEIRYSICDIVCAVGKACQMAESDNVVIFETFLDSSDKSNGTTLSDVWVKTIKAVSEKICYDKCDLKALGEFGTVLGSGDVDTQIKNINKLCLSIKDSIETIKNKKSKNDEVYLKLGIYVGVLLVILLI